MMNVALCKFDMQMKGDNQHIDRYIGIWRNPIYHMENVMVGGRWRCSIYASLALVLREGWKLFFVVFFYYLIGVLRIQ